MRALLCGDKLVRIGFLDEAGRSRQEPVIVVAGLLINGDRTYRQLEHRLREIAEAIPKEEPGSILYFMPKTCSMVMGILRIIAFGRVREGIRCYIH